MIFIMVAFEECCCDRNIWREKCISISIGKHNVGKIYGRKRRQGPTSSHATRIALTTRFCSRIFGGNEASLARTGLMESRTGCRSLNAISIHHYPKTQSYRTNDPHIFGFPLFLLVPLAPLSSAVTSVSDVSAFRLTGSPIADGLFFSFSSAFCFNVLPSSLLDLAPVSSGVGLESAASALRDTGSPSWEGFLSFFSRAMSLRDLLSCWGVSGDVCRI